MITDIHVCSKKMPIGYINLEMVQGSDVVTMDNK